MLKFIIILISVVVTCCAHAEPVETELHLDTKSGKLGGTLTVPSTTTATWVVLIVSGSGPTDRNGNSPLAKNNSLKLLAHALADVGIASVRYDKRGVAGSAEAGTVEENLRFDTYVDDATAWINFLESNHRFAKIAVLGHSEGALIAMLAAKSTKPQAYISIAGTGKKASDMLRTQMEGKLPKELVQENERILTSLERGEKVFSVPTPLMVLYRQSVQPYLISWFKYDPAVILQTISIPTLLIQGSTDIQVGLQDYELLSQAAPAASRQTIPGMNHILKLVESDSAKQIASYSDPDRPISPALVATIVPFLEVISAKILVPIKPPQHN